MSRSRLLKLLHLGLISAIVAVTTSGCQWSASSATATPIAPRPNVVAVPIELRAGEQLTAIGDTWLAGEEVALTLVPAGTNPSGSIVIGITRADAEGRFRFTGPVPVSAPAGPYDLLAQSSVVGRPFAKTGVTLLAATALIIPSDTPAPPASPTTPPTATQPPPPPPPPPTRVPTTAPAPTQPPPPAASPTAPPPPPAPATATSAPSYPDWRGEYWDNLTFRGRPDVTRNDPVLDFDWRTGSPDRRIPFDNFSARWQRVQYFDGGTWRFTLIVDDGARLFIDDVLVLDAWQDGVRTVDVDVTLGRGSRRLRVEYYERTGNAVIRLAFNQIVPASPTPLPSNTPIPPPATATRIPPTAVPLPTNTPVPLPTATPIPVASATNVPPTATTIPLPTMPLPTMPPLPTHTPVPPTVTPPPTSTPVPLPTNTPAPPTATPIPLPTNTPVPPTATQVPPATATDAPPTATPIPLFTDTPGLPPAPHTPKPVGTITTTAVVSATFDGTLIDISGARWPAGDRITITLAQNIDGSDGIVIGRRTVAANGRWALVDILQPFENPSFVYVIVVGRSGQKTVTPLLIEEPTPAP